MAMDAARLIPEATWRARAARLTAEETTLLCLLHSAEETRRTMWRLDDDEDEVVGSSWRRRKPLWELLREHGELLLKALAAGTTVEALHRYLLAPEQSEKLKLSYPSLRSLQRYDR